MEGRGVSEERDDRVGRGAPGPPDQASQFALRRRLDDGVLRLDVEDLLRTLHQRPPLLLLDRVIALVPGEHAVGLKRVSGNEAGLAVRRHGFVFPSTLGLEALAQLATVVIRGISPPPDPGRHRSAPELALNPLPALQLSEVESLEVHRELDSPAAIHLIVSRLEGEEAGEMRFAGEATIEGELYLSARFLMTTA